MAFLVVRTGQAGQSGVVPSLAEELRDKGAKSCFGLGSVGFRIGCNGSSSSVVWGISGGICTDEALSRLPGR
jgi:hypothetical protein